MRQEEERVMAAVCAYIERTEGSRFICGESDLASKFRSKKWWRYTISRLFLILPQRGSDGKIGQLGDLWP